METKPLIPQALIAEGLENARLFVFIQYLLSFDQNVRYLIVFTIFFYDVTSSGLSW